MKLLDKVYSVLRLAKNVSLRRREYTLTFFSEKIDGKRHWYYEFRHWGFKKYWLMMVAGADLLCDKYSEGYDRFQVDVIASDSLLFEKVDEYDCFEAVFPYPELSFVSKITYGRSYMNMVDGTVFWLCPVTLFVLGRYPKYLYVKRHDEERD